MIRTLLNLGFSQRSQMVVEVLAMAWMLLGGNGGGRGGGAGASTQAETQNLLESFIYLFIYLFKKKFF